MKDLVFFIPAQETNKYHKLGDLAPFGDTTLLQWKISQCKKVVGDDCIYISSTSDKIKDVSIIENVSHIRRSNLSIEKELKLFAEKIKENTIIWANVTSPFLGNFEFSKMYRQFVDSDCDLLMSVLEKKDYAFYHGERINFKSKFIDRSDIDPIVLATNGVYIFNKKYISQDNDLLDTERIHFYRLDKLPAIEIKDILDYSISQDLISLYFSNMID